MSPAKGVTARFRADLAEVCSRYAKRTSAGHKRTVFLLVLAGALLRGWMLFAPITYDEAHAFIRSATSPLHVLLSDWSHPDNHILHTLLVKISTGLFGVGKVSLRLPAFLAGVLVMPLFYFFVRATFNRYIALMALALVAASGGLVEYSALARGHSLVWLAMVVALLFGRHFLRENNAVSAMLIGIALALGMWAAPMAVYPALMTYLWLLLSLLFRHKEDLGQRLPLWVLSLVVFLAATALCYLPVVKAHGLDQLLHHDSLPKNTWAGFVKTYPERVLEFWGHLSDTTATWFAFAGLGAVAFAGYVSGKYRMLLGAMVLGAVPLAMVRAEVAPLHAWFYTLFVLHLSMAIGLFYLLKGVSERYFSAWSKRNRTLAASVALLAGTAWPGMRTAPDHVERFSEAAACASYLNGAMEPGDRALLEFPCEAPVEFHALALGMDGDLLHAAPAPGSRLFIVTSPGHRQSPETVLARHGLHREQLDPLELVKDWERLEIFAARLRSGSAGASAGEALQP